MSSGANLVAMPNPIPEIDGLTYVRPLGRGSWGYVLEYVNERNGARYACKFLEPNETAAKQLKERGQTLEDVLKKESLDGNTKSLPNVGYATLERTKDGSSYVRMEYADRFLRDVDIKSMDFDEKVDISRGMAISLRSLHKEGKKHGDYHPGNIGYTKQREVKAFDFGTATVGVKAKKNVGAKMVRAPERFREEEIRSASDVWAVGANMYRLFTGEFPLEQEIGRSENPEEVVSALYQNDKVWNTLIDGKLRDKKVPKAFRPLLRDCLYDEESRIQDGERLVNELEKAIVRHERSKPKSRILRWGLALAAGLGISIGGYHTYKANELEKEKAKIEQEAKWMKKFNEEEAKKNVIRFYDLGERTGPGDFDKYIGLQKISALELIYGDKKTAFAAFYNHEAVKEAIELNEGNTDYKSLEPILERIDKDTPFFVRTSKGYFDNWMLHIGSETRKEVLDEWKEDTEAVKKRCDSLLEEAIEREEEVRKTSVNGIPTLKNDAFGTMLLLDCASYEKIEKAIGR